ncbi:DNA polymerase III beta subunit [Salsuginibacillus halophilus]|uniref:Beta sliding clamp n=1 Tax=Salsuginibacillus halophilus TaxID=517424 RepID=A0A2P8HI99_9BACI|nr:DNA polymerase III subunit beta [Salsuginibacillus halophilus]PSL45943.1 DNA polymerase III beta subunit [Salsuginibacillus halophilus]
MKFTIDREEFVQGVQHVNRAISPRSTINVLTGIKIEADTDGLTLIGSDSDISIQSFIPVADEEKEYLQIEQPGSVVLQAKYFVDIVKKLPGDTIEIEVQEQFAATVRSGAVVFNLNGLDPEEYPRLPKLEEDQSFKIPQHLLKDMIRQTVFAVSSQETRPVLTGVNLEIEEGKMTFTATDSHRLAMRSAEVETDASLSLSNIVIPGKSLTELSRIMDDAEDLIEVVVTETQVLFKFDRLMFFSRLLDGKYPVTKNMVPTQTKTDVTLERNDLVQALERALLLSREAKNNVINVKTAGDALIEITSVSAEIGKVQENIEVASLNGEDLRISFNGKNILDALKVIDSDVISIQFTGAMSPFVVRPQDHDQMLHLFSPVRTY